MAYLSVMWTCTHQRSERASVHNCRGDCPPVTLWVYLTEDDGDSRLYRFRPDRAGDLSSGVLEALAAEGMGVWHETSTPYDSPTFGSTDTSRRHTLCSRCSTTPPQLIPPRMR